MHEIEAWKKSGKPWLLGLILVSKYCSKGVYSALVAAGQNKISEAKMLSSLSKALMPSKPEIQKASANPVTSKPPEPKTQHPDLEALTIAANKHYQKMAVLQNRILATKDENDRIELYKSFLAAQLRWAEAAFERDHLREFGTPAPVKSRKKLNTSALPTSEHVELIRLRSKVTRAINEQLPLYRTKPGKRWADKLAARELEVKRWQQRIAEIEKGGAHG